MDRINHRRPYLRFTFVSMLLTFSAPVVGFFLYAWFVVGGVYWWLGALEFAAVYVAVAALCHLLEYLRWLGASIEWLMDQDRTTIEVTTIDPAAPLRSLQVDATVIDDYPEEEAKW